MTRYTKLEGRRAIPSGGGLMRIEADAENDSEGTDVESPRPKLVQEDIQLDPKKLLKRSKLLRLKAKKAKSEEARLKLLHESKKMEKMVAKANGAFGQRKADAKDSAFSKRVRLDPDQRRAFRRMKRAEERQSTMRCFVCRELSHSAKECPQRVGNAAQGKDTVGICFRCGSTEHNLSQCKRARNENDELPFAICYICSNKGHLASKCHLNQGRGVYPDGGHCKVCRSVEHLAKDCPMDPRRHVHASSVEAGGVGILADAQGAGADDDEFHVLAQRRTQLRPEAKALPRPAPKVVRF